MGNLLEQNLSVLNIGLRQFCTALDAQKVKALHVEWRPPAADDSAIESLLDALL